MTGLKKCFKILTQFARYPALYLLRYFNRFLRRVTSFFHKMQLYGEWGYKPNPEWFDHFIDQYYQWSATKTPYCWERGIFSLLCLKKDAKVLELCCGDGFNAHHFYSIRSKTVLSVDFDQSAIKHAKKNFHDDNIEYRVADIRYDFPKGQYTNIIWDAAIEHFTLEEMDIIFKNILLCLDNDGILSGYTIVAHDNLAHDDHEHEFESKQELKHFLKKYFEYVVVFDTEYPDRHNLYFYASREPLAFLYDFSIGLVNPIAS